MPSARRPNGGCPPACHPLPAWRLGQRPSWNESEAARPGQWRRVRYRAADRSRRFGSCCWQYEPGAVNRGADRVTRLGLYKTELIYRHRATWAGRNEVETERPGPRARGATTVNGASSHVRHCDIEHVGRRGRLAALEAPGRHDRNSGCPTLRQSEGALVRLKQSGCEIGRAGPRSRTAIDAALKPRGGGQMSA